jgi:hypothetical protein
MEVDARAEILVPPETAGQNPFVACARASRISFWIRSVRRPATAGAATPAAPGWITVVGSSPALVKELAASSGIITGSALSVPIVVAIVGHGTLLTSEPTHRER